MAVFDYQNIFNANRDALAANPSSLPAGLQLVLPCEDGRLTPDQELSCGHRDRDPEAGSQQDQVERLRAAAEVRHLEQLDALHG